MCNLIQITKRKYCHHYDISFHKSITKLLMFGNLSVKSLVSASTHSRIVLRQSLPMMFAHFYVNKDLNYSVFIVFFSANKTLVYIFYGDRKISCGLQNWEYRPKGNRQTDSLMALIFRWKMVTYALCGKQIYIHRLLLTCMQFRTRC